MCQRSLNRTTVGSFTASSGCRASAFGTMRGGVAIQAIAPGSPGTAIRWTADADADGDGTAGTVLAESIVRAAGGVRHDATAPTEQRARNLREIFRSIRLVVGPVGSALRLSPHQWSCRENFRCSRRED
jgi:hypothetical protein